MKIEYCIDYLLFNRNILYCKSFFQIHCLDNLQYLIETFCIVNLQKIPPNFLQLFDLIETFCIVNTNDLIKTTLH